MFYLFPATQTVLNNNCTNNNVPKSTPKWSMLEKTGLLLDILIVASLCIAATLALCLHFGAHLGPLNALSVLKVPVLTTFWCVAATLLVADVVKVVRKQCRNLKKQNNQPLVDSPQPILDPLANGGQSIIHSGTLPEPQKKTPTFPPRIQKSPLIDLSEQPEKDLSDSFIMMDPNSSDPEAPRQTAWTWDDLLKGAVNALVYGANALAIASFEFLKDWLKPGEIQMRFYSLQVNFLVEQILSYNDSEERFEPTPIPLSYHAKLKKLVEKEFTDPDIQEFKKRVIQIIYENKECHFSTRYYLLSEIENAFGQLNKKSPKFHLFLQKLCYQLYTEFDGFTYGENILGQFLNKPKLSFENMPAILEADCEQIKALSANVAGTVLRDARDRLKGSTSVAFYPMITNNFASQLWKETYTNGNTVQIIRFGSPTIQYAGPATVLGQMQLFVQECIRNNQNLLSFQHQTFNGLGEDLRLKAMLNLAEIYPQAFYFLNLDMDSDFYHQQRKNIDTSEENTDISIGYADFKKSLVDHIEGLTMSKNLKQKISQIPSYHQDLEQLADEVRGYFPGHEGNFTREERKDFIFLFYARYRQYLHSKISPTFSCHQCKDTMDRSMSLAACSFLINSMDLDMHQDSNQLSYFRTLVNFVGVIVKGSPMHGGRFKRFLPVVKRLTSLKTRPNLFSYVARQEMHGSTFNYTYSKLPCDAETIEDYRKCDLLKPTPNGDYVSVMPIKDASTLPKIVKHLYQNNGLNCSVKIEDNRFSVSQGNNKLITGEFALTKDFLTISITASVLSHHRTSSVEYGSFD